MKHTIVGGPPSLPPWLRYATEGGKEKEVRRGGECRKEGKRERMAKMWSWEVRRSLVGWWKYQCPSSCARTASTSEGEDWEMRVSKMTMCLLCFVIVIKSNYELIRWNEMS